MITTRTLALLTAIAISACDDEAPIGADASMFARDAAVTRDAQPAADAAAAADARPADDAGMIATADGGDAATDDDGGAVLVQAVTGTISGGAPANGELFVMWQVTTGSPDYVYAFMTGSSVQTAYGIPFIGPPPAEAINADGIAVGFVVLLPPGTPPPAAGRIMGRLEPLIRGLSPREVLIYKTTNAVSARPWAAAFRAGFSCGRCVPNPAGFDGFEAIECLGIDVEIPASGDFDDLDICDWT